MVNFFPEALPGPTVPFCTLVGAVEDEGVVCFAGVAAVEGVVCFAGVAAVADVVDWVGCCAVEVPLVFFVFTYLPLVNFFPSLAGPDVVFSCANPVNAKQSPITTVKKNTNAFFILLSLL